MTVKKLHSQFSIADPRWLQILLLSLFLVFVWFFLDTYSNGLIYVAAVASCVLVQFFWILRLGLPLNSLLSALISALGLCLLLKVNTPYWMALAGVLTISSKFLIKANGKHIFNPTNFGIVLMVLLSVGWVSPGQWGSGGLVLLLISVGAGFILFGVGRWDVALSFLIALFGLEAARVIFYLGWELDVLLHNFNNGTLLIFAFFMITDPRTSPNSRKGRVLWGVMMAVLSFAFGQFFYWYQAPIFALFFLSIVTPIIDRLLVAPQFKWNAILTKQIDKL